MTRYHRKWDRRERLLRAALRLLKKMAPYAGSAELYDDAKRMVNRIKRELDRG